MQLTDHAVVVVGAAGGIGRAVCEEMLALGARVAALDRPGPAIDTLAESINEPRLRSYAGDASDLHSMRLISECIHGELGPVHGLVNAAGKFEIVPFIDSPPEHWDAMVRDNLYSAMASCRAFVPSMVARGGGSVVNFASTAGEHGSIRPSAAYAAAKGGVIAFSKSLAREVSPAGVRVNVVSPGPVGTTMLDASSKEALDDAQSRTLFGRVGTPADVSAAVAYLIGDGSTWVTGSVLRVNGGSLL